MRYADGGGLTVQGRSRREQVRLRAAEMFAQDTDARLASSLRVSTKSVYQWRRAWRAGGKAALASKGVGANPCKLDEVGAGPAVDPGPGRGAGHAPVRRLLHAASRHFPSASHW
jgi:hypothetical protein